MPIRRSFAVVFLLVSLLVVLGPVACDGTAGEPGLADCDALAAEQPACMDEAAIADCEDANEECAGAGGDVVVAESCPLQFSCSST